MTSFVFEVGTGKKDIDALMVLGNNMLPTISTHLQCTQKMQLHT